MGMQAAETAAAALMPSTHQAMLAVEHVHGAALAAATPGLLSKQLAHDLAGRHALGQDVHVVAVGGGDEVVLAQAGLDDACGQGGMGGGGGGGVSGGLVAAASRALAGWVRGQVCGWGCLRRTAAVLAPQRWLACW